MTYDLFCADVVQISGKVRKKQESKYTDWK